MQIGTGAQHPINHRHMKSPRLVNSQPKRRITVRVITVIARRGDSENRRTVVESNKDVGASGILQIELVNAALVLVETGAIRGYLSTCESVIGSPWAVGPVVTTGSFQMAGFDVFVDFRAWDEA